MTTTTQTRLFRWTVETIDNNGQPWPMKYRCEVDGVDYTIRRAAGNGWELIIEGYGRQVWPWGHNGITSKSVSACKAAARRYQRSH